MKITQKKKFLKFLAGELNDRFEKEHLNKIKRHLNQLKYDPSYALKSLKMFFTAYGYATGGRSGTKAAKVAMIKTIGECMRGRDVNFNTYKKFFHPQNPIPKSDIRKNNPGLCRYLYKQMKSTKNWLPHMIKDIKKGKLEESYNELKRIDGIGQKIAALFIRDIISLTSNENKIFDKLQDKDKVKQYLYAFPVDIWVREIADHIKMGKPRVQGLIKLSLDSGISPLKVNAGAWYLGAKVVADTDRLKKLLQNKTLKGIKKEFQLMEDVLQLI